MQAIFEGGEEDFFFMNQNLNTSISDLFFGEHDTTIPSEEAISGSPSESQSPPPSYLSIPTIQPNIIFKQEINSQEDETEYKIPKIEPDNKRKRSTKTENNEKLDKKSPAQKKIRKKHPEMQTSVTLSREKLLTTSTEEFNKWVDELKSTRPLTQEEVQDIRRQKRLIRNRESAQASRDRKKNEFSLLEKQIKQLKEEKEMAMREISEMRNRINNLETENLYMKTTIQHNPVLNELYTGIGSMQQSSKSQTTQNSFINSKTVKNAGVCLFLLIFSFGLFFNVQNSINQSQPKVYIPQNIPTSASLPQPIANTNTLRPLGTNARKLLSKTKTQINSLQALSNQPIPNLPQNVQEGQVSPIYVKPVQEEIVASNETLIEQQKQQQSSIQPNLHLYCMNAKEYIINPTKETNDLIISLMLPRQSISSNSPIHNYVNSNDDLIEVNCKVLSPTKI